MSEDNRSGAFDLFHRRYPNEGAERMAELNRALAEVGSYTAGIPRCASCHQQLPAYSEAKNCGPCRKKITLGRQKRARMDEAARQRKNESAKLSRLRLATKEGNARRRLALVERQKARVEKARAKLAARGIKVDP